jgi:hypothetical protein
MIAPDALRLTSPYPRPQPSLLARIGSRDKRIYWGRFLS